MPSPKCECTISIDTLGLLSHEQHVAFHVGNVEVQVQALEALFEAGVDEEELEEIGGSFGLLAN